MRWRQGFVTAEGSFDAGGPVTSHVFRAEGTQHVFFTSYSDGHIHEYWWKSRPAQHGDLMHASGAPRGVGPIASHVVEAEGTQHVFYQSSDQHIYELWWRSGEAVHVGDLTSASGGPLAAPDLGPLLTGSLASHVFTAEGTQHVFYASGDGQVHELSWSGAARPIYKNLTQRTRRGGPAPRATGPLTSHVVDATGVQHLFYVADGDVIELSWEPGQDPALRNLTSQTPGAPGVAGVSPLTSHVVDAEGAQHVFYVSADGHINELWWPGVERPRREDLTFQSGGSIVTFTGPPTAFLKVPGHVLRSEGTQHVFFSTRRKTFEIWEI